MWLSSLIQVFYGDAVEVSSGATRVLNQRVPNCYLYAGRTSALLGTVEDGAAKRTMRYRFSSGLDLQDAEK